MIITITNVEQAFTSSGAEFQKVTGTTGDGMVTTKSVFDKLKVKWPLLQPNITLDFKLEKRGQFWNVVDILPVEGQLPPPVKPDVPPPTAEERVARPAKVEEAAKKPTEPPVVIPPGQEIGMTTKEIGDMIRVGKLWDIFGAETGAELIKWYRSRILGTTRIPYDGANLPSTFIIKVEIC